MALLPKNWTLMVQIIAGTLFLCVISCSGSTQPEFEPKTPEIVIETPNADTSLGMGVYNKHCAACHGLNGKGNGFAADFVNDKERMSKSDEELLNSIRNGFTGKIGYMPSWKTRLNEEEIVSVLAFIRETFGK
jgi:mono/diheme cytochrome c family protein